MTPRRVLMTLDAVGGVWRYAVDLADALGASGTQVVLTGLGPAPSPAQRVEVARLSNVRLEWLDEPLDWMAGPDGLDGVPQALARLARCHAVDLLHLNLPSQAWALRPLLPERVAVVAASHSCLPTWWDAVKGGSLPEAWHWHRERNRAGLAAADAVIAPSRSHGEHLVACYGPIDRLAVVHNAATPGAATEKQPFVLGAARWWDEGKNGALLDDVARLIDWPLVAAGAISGGQGQRIELPHVDARGELPHTEVAHLMAEAAILISPSLYEPFGLTVLEGATRGAALVLSDIPTYRELWSDAALFAPPRDPSAFASAVSRLAADEALRTDLASRATGRAHRYRPARQVAQVREAYAAAIRHAEPRSVSAA